MELFKGNCTQFCPVTALGQFLRIRPKVDGALFIHLDGSFLSKFQFTAVFCKCLGVGGLVQGDYAAHSFCIGAATEVARWGLPEEVIKHIGRWESTRHRIYVPPHL